MISLQSLQCCFFLILDFYLNYTNMDAIIQKIKKQISNYPILLYMKGSPDLPSCGFSSQAVKVLLKCNQSFAYVNILEHADIRAILPRFSNWPTYPQLWIDSKLIGGCDIMVEMYRKNELQKLIQSIKLKCNLRKEVNSLNISNAAL